MSTLYLVKLICKCPLLAGKRPLGCPGVVDLLKGQ